MDRREDRQKSGSRRRQAEGWIEERTGRRMDQGEDRQKGG